jgi:hypothetical protein
LLVLSFPLPVALSDITGNVIVADGDPGHQNATDFTTSTPGRAASFAGGTARITGVVGRPPWMIGSLGGRCDVRNEM